MLCEGRGYSKPDGAVKAITAFKKAVDSGEFSIEQDKFDRFRFILKTSGSQTTYYGESYKTKTQCEKAIQAVKKLAPIADVLPYSE